jgi:glycosyltransferase involved in cell wall biosynthesis
MITARAIHKIVEPVAVATRPMRHTPGPEPPQDLRGMRILVIMPSIPVQGMERSNLQIMKMLRQRGATVSCIVDRQSAEVPREVERIGCTAVLATVARRFDLRLHLSRNPVLMSRVIRAWWQSAMELRRIFEFYRPTHVHVTNLHYFLYALPTLWRARSPVILRLPNPPDTNLPGYKQVLSDWIWKRCVLPFCDAVVCNCQYTLEQLGRFGPLNGDVHIIHNCLENCSAMEISDAPNVRPGTTNVVYLGRIRPDKGVGELCEAAERIVSERADVDFYLAGEYHWMNPFAENWMAQIRRKGLQERIRFVGPIKDVFGLLRQCQIHVCPSVSSTESFPNVLLEAKSQRLPSVVFPTAGIPEAVTHDVDGYICKETTANALYDGIRYFLDNPDRLRAAGQAARQSLEKFSPERIGEHWAELYKSL